MPTIKPKKTSTTAAPSRTVPRKRTSTADAAPARSRRGSARRVPWEHLGHPSSAVVVTGAASGIGRASASHLAEAGRPVAFWDLDERAAKAAAKEAKAAWKVPTIGIGIDVSHSARFADAIKASTKAVGPIGGLVHAAGVSGPMQITDMDDANWDAVLDVNLRAAAILTKQLAPELEHTGPGSAIVYISSIEAFFGHDFLPAYSASKAGLLGLTRSACATLGPKGIRVNSVCPGAVETPMLQPMLDIEGVRSGLEAKTPLLRLAQPDDIAKVVRFLLSDEARFVTGTQLIVDGGLTAIAGI